MKVVLDRGMCIIWIEFGMNRVKWVVWIECEFPDPI